MLAQVVEPEADGHLAGAADVLVQHDQQRRGRLGRQVEGGEQEVRTRLGRRPQVDHAAVAGGRARADEAHGLGRGLAGTGGGEVRRAPVARPDHGARRQRGGRHDGGQRGGDRGHRDGRREGPPPDRRARGGRARRGAARLPVLRCTRSPVQQVGERGRPACAAVASSLAQPWPAFGTSVASTHPAAAGGPGPDLDAGLVVGGVAPRSRRCCVNTARRRLGRARRQPQRLDEDRLGEADGAVLLAVQREHVGGGDAVLALGSRASRSRRRPRRAAPGRPQT